MSNCVKCNKPIKEGEPTITLECAKRCADDLASQLIDEFRKILKKNNDAFKQILLNDDDL